GGQVPVGDMIGVIADPADDIGAVASAPPAPAAPAPSTKRADAPAAAPIPAMESYRSVPATNAVVPMTPMPAQAPGRDGRVKASPRARRIAAPPGVDLRVPQGRGPGGRIVRRDVESAAPAPRPAPAPAVVATAPAAPRPQFVVPQRTEAEYEDRALSPMRATIAKRMPLSKAPVPHFYVTSAASMHPAWRLPADLHALP